MATDLPATSEVLLQTDASKHILDTFLGQGWDSWGASLGGSQASELMLEMFSAFNLIALAVISALFLWVLAVAVAGTAHEGTPFGKRFSSLWMPLRFVGAMGHWLPFSRDCRSFRWRFWPASAFPSTSATTSGSWVRTILWSMVGSFLPRLRIRTSLSMHPLPTARWNR